MNINKTPSNSTTRSERLIRSYQYTGEFQQLSKHGSHQHLFVLCFEDILNDLANAFYKKKSYLEWLSSPTHKKLIIKLLFENVGLKFTNPRPYNIDNNGEQWIALCHENDHLQFLDKNQMMKLIQAFANTSLLDNPDHCCLQLESMDVEAIIQLDRASANLPKQPKENEYVAFEESLTNIKKRLRNDDPNINEGEELDFFDQGDSNFQFWPGITNDPDLSAPLFPQIQSPYFDLAYNPAPSPPKAQSSYNMGFFNQSSASTQSDAPNWQVDMDYDAYEGILDSL